MRIKFIISPIISFLLRFSLITRAIKSSCNVIILHTENPYIRVAPLVYKMHVTIYHAIFNPALFYLHDQKLLYSITADLHSYVCSLILSDLCISYASLYYSVHGAWYCIEITLKRIKIKLLSYIYMYKFIKNMLIEDNFYTVCL